MELSNKIKALRAKARFTQEQLAEKLGVAPQTVSKWENSVAMPDISLLPDIAEAFGVSIDDLFDLSAEQRLNRIENRMDIESELPQDVFREYEDYLQPLLGDAAHKKRATYLTAYLYWHRMHSDAQKVKRYAKESIRSSPDEKECQWMLNMAEGHYAWDWNMSNHSNAIEFYRGVAASAPESRLTYMYLIDNLIADHRAAEAEQALERYEKLGGNPVMVFTYRAHIALARFDEPKADKIIEDMLKVYSDKDDALFEAAQYYAKKGDYTRAAGLYEKAYEADTRRPRFTDALYAIAYIYEISGDFASAAKTYDRIIDNIQNEWGLTEDTVLKSAQKEKARLLEKVKTKP
ncbi:MAG: helix-turn-helix domain-containing protein [Clostridia bacterium]|nr:helix-turn-helix domain-containing protein [Clostridia bacterium]